MQKSLDGNAQIQETYDTGLPDINQRCTLEETYLTLIILPFFCFSITLFRVWKQGSSFLQPLFYRVFKQLLEKHIEIETRH